MAAEKVSDSFLILLEGIQPGWGQWEKSFQTVLQEALRTFVGRKEGEDIGLFPLGPLPGKKIRPLLVFLCLRLCGGCVFNPATVQGKHNDIEYQDHILSWNGFTEYNNHPIPGIHTGEHNGQRKDPRGLLAQAVEWLHMASLMHDDVMDEGITRRGGPCAHRVWGNRIAILKGDLWLTIAWDFLLALGSLPVMLCLQRAMQSMVQGQIQESLITWDTPLSTYMDMIQKKTAALFAGTCQAAGILALTTPSQRQFLHTFGMLMGTGFQLRDDVLDCVWEMGGPKSSWGKELGKDFLDGKMTFPTLWLWHHGTPDEKKSLRFLFNAQPGNLSSFLQLMQTSGAIQATWTQAEAFCNRAKDALRGGGPWNLWWNQGYGLWRTLHAIPHRDKRTVNKKMFPCFSSVKSTKKHSFFI